MYTTNGNGGRVFRFRMSHDENEGEASKLCSFLPKAIISATKQHA